MISLFPRASWSFLPLWSKEHWSQEWKSRLNQLNVPDKSFRALWLTTVLILFLIQLSESMTSMSKTMRSTSGGSAGTQANIPFLVFNRQNNRLKKCKYFGIPPNKLIWFQITTTSSTTSNQSTISMWKSQSNSSKNENVCVSRLQHVIEKQRQMHTSMIYHYAALAWEARPTLNQLTLCL